MASVLTVAAAVPSKLRLGEIIVHSHSSEDPIYESLAKGGGIFVVIPRGKKAVWLVAILDSPRRIKRPKLPARWQASDNTARITEVSSMVSVPATPRGLTADEEAALRAAVRGRVSAVAPTSWRFERALDAASAKKKLGPIHRAQLAVVCTFYDGRDTQVDALPPAIFSKQVELYRVFEGRRHAFDFWSMVDSGTLFFANDAEPAGIEVIQGGWDVYPKLGWVKRGMKLDLPHLAWELGTAFDRMRHAHAKPSPEPSRGGRVRPMKWKTRGPRQGDLGS